MALPIQINVGLLGPLGAGTQAQGPAADKYGRLVVQEGNGKYAEACRLGQMFTGSIPAAGVAVPLYSATTQQCVLYNPPSSTTALWLRKIFIGYVSGTDVAGFFCLAQQTAIANTISGTTSTSFISNNRLTGTANGAGVFAGSNALLYTAATVTAFTFLRNIGQNQVAQTAASTNAPWSQVEDLDGSIVLNPGAAICVAGNAASFVTANISIDWVEAPVGYALVA